MSNNRHKYRIPFFDNSGKFIGFEDLDILKGVQPYNAGVCHRGEPEQCIGLTDKNGTLIYEGDVVRCDIDFVPDGRVGLVRTVIFKDGAFQLSCKDGFYFIMGFHNIEIIGNIHDEQFRDATKMVEGEQC